MSQALAAPKRGHVVAHLSCLSSSGCLPRTR
jgi:hypothetical protein